MSTTTLKNTDLIEEVNNLSYDPGLFSHETRMRISWILNKQLNLKDAILKYDELITTYIEKVATNQYNSSELNRAYIEIIDYFMDKSTGNDFEKLLSEFPRLKYNFKALVKTHYGYDILKNDHQEISKPNRPILFTF